MKVMAEDTGLEPVTLAGDALAGRFLVQSDVFRSGPRGIRTRTCAGFKPAVSALDYRPSGKWCGRRDSNPDTHGLNVLDMPVLLRPRMVERAGVEPAMFTAGVTALQAAAFATGPPLHKWSARSASNRHCAAPRAAASASWATRRRSGGPCRCRTCASSSFEDGASACLG